MRTTDFALRGPEDPDGAGVNDIVLSSVHNLAFVHDTARSHLSRPRPRHTSARPAPHPQPENRMTTALATTPPATPEPPDPPLPHRIWHYPADPPSAPKARHHVTAQLGHWGLGSLADTAAIVTSELVTNALATSHRACQDGDDDLTSQIALRLTYSHQDVIVEVWDGGTGRPTRRATGPDAEDGRGLHLVAALSRDTGHYQARVRTAVGYRPKGKVVWAALSHNAPPVGLAPTVLAGDLPRRAPSSGPAETAQAPDVFDLALLQRVRDGLRNLDDWTHHSHDGHRIPPA
ncbi:ATP-binding protein [Parafrankia sp. BMG5.11]|uniref:ATP-binding protein n=1 Tax=Parafrankia sp. BMG5.11 TaxID=222540 RepID=UPI001FB20282|nr:ATP-binding protein [Parafrankia sp. BMG5.11]